MSARPEVLLVRHGATAWSVARRHTGRTDLPLLSEGEIEAAAVGDRLAHRAFAAVFASPLQRARRTAELAGFGDHPHLHVDPDLVEWDYGEIEGRTTAEVRESQPGWTVWAGPLPGGESPADVGVRADRVIDRLRAVDGEVVVFAHGHMLRILTARWCGWDPVEGQHLPLATGALSTLGWEHETPGITGWNQR